MHLLFERKCIKDADPSASKFRIGNPCIETWHRSGMGREWGGHGSRMGRELPKQSWRRLGTAAISSGTAQEYDCDSTHCVLKSLCNNAR